MIDEPGAIRLGFDRFLHYLAPTELDVTIPVSGPTTQIRISRSYLMQFEVKSIVPEPAAVESSNDALLYTFSVAPGAADLRVKFHLTPNVFGRVSGYAGTAEGRDHRLSHLIYP